MKRLKGYSILIIVSLISFYLSSEAIAEQSYPLMCKGGGNMKLALTGFEKNDLHMFLYFDKSPHAASQQPPGPGQCAWLDRPLNSSETARLSGDNPGIAFSAIHFENGQTIIFNPTSNYKYLYESIKNNQIFYVHCYMPPGGVLKITRYGP